MRLRAVVTLAISILFMAGSGSAKERLYWDYSQADQGIIVLSRDKPAQRRAPPRSGLGLNCLTAGYLYVEDPALILWIDVGGGNGDTYSRLALETSTIRLEAPIEVQNSRYVGWASAKFPITDALIDHVLATSFIVVRAINDKAVSERGLDNGDMANSYPSPDWKKAGPFRDFCRKSLSSRTSE